MEAEFCIEALQEALAKHGKPEIFNSDQGSQFTSADFTSVLLKNGIAISMDGKGSWRDNVFIERLWRSVKWEEWCAVETCFAVGRSALSEMEEGPPKTVCRGSLQTTTSCEVKSSRGERCWKRRGHPVRYVS